MPLDYFMALGVPGTDALVSDADTLSALGMIYWDDPIANPQGLPIGLTVDRGRTDAELQLGMNCSACHVTEIQVGDRTALVDGGVSHFDFWSFMTTLQTALQVTYDDQAEFDRFLARLTARQDLVTQPDQVRARLRQVLREHQDWDFRNHTTAIPGPGRVDALNVILNQVTAGMLQRPENAREPDAPVSYPYLWDAPYLDVVQYNGVVPNAGAGALGRNIGQVLGVFGQVDMALGAVPVGYDSSVNVNHLIALEERLETLTSPAWADFAQTGLLPDLDGALLTAGAQVYDQQCAACHSVIDPKDRGPLASIKVPTFDLASIGTDPGAALSFAAREVVTGPLEGRKIGVVTGDAFCEVTHGNAVLAHVVAGVMLHNFSDDWHMIAAASRDIVESSLHSKMSHIGQSMRRMLGLASQEQDPAPIDYGAVMDALAAKGLSEEQITAELEKLSDNNAALFDELVRDHFAYHGEDQICMQNLQTAQYRARPLNGIWATGPFLHNGSVPTLADLLRPADQRPARFAVGAGGFDPVNVGFVTDAAEGAFMFDVTQTGNSNAGHEFGVDLSDTDRAALLEYFKSL